MLNQCAVDNPTLPVNQCFSHLSETLAECQAVLWECRAATMGRQALGTRMVYRNVFANPDASSSAPCQQELNPWSSSTEEPLHSSTVEKSERRTQDQDQRCQSGQSAKNSVIFIGGDSSKNYGADQQRPQISDPHFDEILSPATFACWKIPSGQKDG